MTEEKKSDDFPKFKSLQAQSKKHLTQEIWDKYKNHKTKTSGTRLFDVIRNGIETDYCHVGVYAGDKDCYFDFKDFFDPVIADIHNLENIKKNRKENEPLHVSDMNPKSITSKINDNVPVISTRIRVGRNIEGYGLSPGIKKEHRLEVESLMKEIFNGLEGDLAGTYYPLKGMDEKVRQKLVDDHFLFQSGDESLRIGRMERDWPEGRGIFHNKAKTFLVWVNEEDQLRIISMEKGKDVVGVFERLSRGVKAIEEGLKKKGKKFQFDNDHGYFHTCPTNLGTGMRASVHVPLPGWNKKGKDKLKARCKELGTQARGAHGETTKDDSGVFDISNYYRLGYTEANLVSMMITGVNTVHEEDQKDL